MRILKGKLHWVENLWLRLRYGAGCCDTYSYVWYLSKRLSNDLKLFKKRCMSHPMDTTEEEWDKILDEMIWAFEYLENEDSYDYKKKDSNRCDRGLKLFGKYFRNLWY